jgi:hypothetical protein
MRVRLLWTAILILSIALPSTALAATFKGVEMADKVEIEGQAMTLQGQGLRSKYFFKVYVGGLYLATPTSDAQQAIAADEPKQIVMSFLRDVGGDKMMDAYREGFAANAPDAMEAIKDRVDTFVGMFNKEVTEGQVIALTYLPGKGTTVAFNGEVAGVIEGSDFMQALWSIWLGPKPPNDDLKEGMLGQQ